MWYVSTLSYSDIEYMLCMYVEEHVVCVHFVTLSMYAMYAWRSTCYMCEVLGL